MNPNDQSEQANQLEIEKRRTDTEKDMYVVLNAILKKPQSNLTVDDKGFLQARRDYLTKGQREEYSDVLHEKLPRPDGQEESQFEPTREELNAEAHDLGIANPEKMKNKTEVQTAIDEAKANQNN